MSEFLIRQANAADIAGIVALQRACFPAPFPSEMLFQPEHIVRHLNQFPEGQFVAVHDSRIVGSCSNMLVTKTVWDSHLPWDSVTGGLGLINHNPTGDWVYGIDISVHPDWRGQGIARQLYLARYELASNNDWNYGTVCRLPGFQSSGFDSPAQYVDAVAGQHMSDPTLTPLLRLGLTYVAVISGYLEDPESGHAGAILEWNP